MLAIFIGVVMVLCAHQAAKKVEDLQEAHADKDEHPFAYRKEMAALVVAVTAPLMVLIATTIWRGQVFTADAQATGGPVDSGIVTVALYFSRCWRLWSPCWLEWAIGEWRLCAPFGMNGPSLPTSVGTGKESLTEPSGPSGQ